LQLAGALGHAATDRRLEILREVGDCGSISQAARNVGVSYKAAWQALDMLSNLAGVPLVERSVGGAGGGGATLTRAGEQLLRAGRELAKTREQVLGRLGAAPAAALGLRTSMRNQMPCTVAALDVHGPLVRVRLATAAGQELASRITAESAELLGLQAGLAVIALCKATAVQVARPFPAAKQVNAVEGKVTRVARGDAGDEVAVQVAGGLSLVGFAGAQSGLRSGSRVVCAFEESAVVLAL
jgi:molybdate transport system regulatory protein